MRGHRLAIAALLDDVDALGLKVTWLDEGCDGWRCVTTPVRVDGTQAVAAQGPTPLAALAAVMRRREIR